MFRRFFVMCAVTIRPQHIYCFSWNTIRYSGTTLQPCLQRPEGFVGGLTTEQVCLDDASLLSNCLPRVEPVDGIGDTLIRCGLRQAQAERDIKRTIQL